MRDLNFGVIKTLSIFVLVFSLSSSCRSQTNAKVWTKKYEQGLYDYLDSSLKPTMPDPVERKKYVLYFVMRAKQEIPNGINSVSKDSLHNLNIRIGREYATKEHNAGNSIALKPSYERWSPFIEKAFRDDFAIIFKDKGLNYSNDLCECVIKKLKKIYPDSLVIPVPKNIMKDVSYQCKHEINLK